MSVRSAHEKGIDSEPQIRRFLESLLLKLGIDRPQVARDQRHRLLAITQEKNFCVQRIVNSGRRLIFAGPITGQRNLISCDVRRDVAGSGADIERPGGSGGEKASESKENNSGRWIHEHISKAETSAGQAPTMHGTLRAQLHGRSPESH